MDADVAGELDRSLVGLRLQPVEVDAGLDLDASRRHPEIDGDRRAELERRFDLVHALRGDADGEEAAAAEQRHGQAERLFARREVELDRDRPASRTAG